MKSFLLLIFLFCGGVGIIPAQKQKASNGTNTHWFVGVDAGISCGSSTLKSFGLDKIRFGYSGGILGGYHINTFLSVEAEFRYHHLRLGTYDCCEHLWLGTDGNRYFAPVVGMDSWQYNDIHSSISLYGLGSGLNIDFVNIFYPESRWSFLLSPTIYGMKSSTKIKTISADRTIRDGSTIHFGVEGALAIGYQISQRINIRLYSGITCLTGKGMDAMPQAEHKSNYMWNNGVKVFFNIWK